MTQEEILGASINYTDKTVEGGGALKGKNCTIKSISAITGGHRVTFEWTLNDGTKDTASMDVMDGAEGEKGEKGDRGAIGPAGSQGIQGVQGPAGPKGDTGAQGPAGPQGVQGIQGIQGPKGDDGYPFLIYRQYNDISEFNPSHFPEIGLLFMVMQEDFDPSDPSVSIGYPIYRFLGQGTPPYSLVVHLASQGIKGDKGDKGDTGAQGPQGLQGIQGEKGDKGDKGDTGAQGVQGEQGIGLPDGGTAGQVLVKYSNEDYDFDWKDTTDRVRPNSHALVESGSVYSAINEALNTIYTPRGDLTCAELTASLLIEDNVGNVYQMTDSGETSALFINGAGITINVNDNVGIIKAGPNTIMFNYMGNAFDLHAYQKKDLASEVEGATTVEGALGALSTNKALKTDITYKNKSLTTTSIDDFGATLVANSVGSYSGTVSVNGTWYNYQSTIQGDLSGSWYGNAILWGDSGDFYTFRKGYSTSTTWIQKKFVTNEIVPSDASASNKLVAHQTPYESFTLNNNSGTQKWYKLGTYTSGNNTARLDFVSARVDGQMFESSVRISGVGTNSNYVSWIGENGCEISTIDIKVDTNRNLYVKMNSYSAVEIRVYGVFTLNIAEQSSEPSGTQIVIEKLVTESDIIVSANGDDSTALGTNVSSTWRITSNGSLCVCYGINTVAFNAGTTNMVSMQLPSGYIFDCVISANVFIDGNSSWVTGASHTSGNGAGTYTTASGTVNPGSFRQIVFAHKA